MYTGSMFFIFGTPRSGTTILAQCLNSHSQVIIPHETDFIVPMAYIYERVQEPGIGRDLISRLIPATRDFSSLGEYLSGDEIAKLVHTAPYQPASILEAIYGAIASKAGVLLAGDKSPNDIHSMKMLWETGVIGPNTKVIHIVRDIRDVMVSLEKTGWLPDGGSYFPRFWNNDNLYTYFKFSSIPERYRLVRYCDFVKSPQKSLEMLCDFLGIQFEPAMLEITRRSDRYKDQEAHQNLYKPVQADSIGQYLNLPREWLAYYETQAQEALNFFGFPLETRSFRRKIFYRIKHSIPGLSKLKNKIP